MKAFNLLIILILLFSTSQFLLADEGGEVKTSDTVINEGLDEDESDCMVYKGKKYCDDFSFSNLSSLAPIPGLSDNKGCTNTCHVMAPMAEEWRQSKHGGGVNSVNCLDCHSRPGIIGTAKDKIGGMIQMKENIFKYEYRGLNKNEMGHAFSVAQERIIGTNRCAECHFNKDTNLNNFKEGAREPHMEFIGINKATRKCFNCHNGGNDEDGFLWHRDATEEYDLYKKTHDKEK